MVNVNLPMELLKAIRANRHTRADLHSSVVTELTNDTGVVLKWERRRHVRHRVEGEDKAGLREELGGDAESEGMRFHMMKYNTLIFTLSSSFGSYVPLRIPVRSLMAEPGKEEKVSMVIEPELELEKWVW